MEKCSQNVASLQLGSESGDTRAIIKPIYIYIILSIRVTL